jgi:hypothetical protein
MIAVNIKIPKNNLSKSVESPNVKIPNATKMPPKRAVRNLGR